MLSRTDNGRHVFVSTHIAAVGAAQHVPPVAGKIGAAAHRPLGKAEAAAEAATARAFTKGATS